jgi:hypothetical protein
MRRNEGSLDFERVHRLKMRLGRRIRVQGCTIGRDVYALCRYLVDSRTAEQTCMTKWSFHGRCYNRVFEKQMYWCL